MKFKIVLTVLKDGKLAGKPELQKVKRAAPGDEGLVANPYSSEAMKIYLKPFDRAFKGFPNDNRSADR